MLSFQKIRTWYQRQPILREAAPGGSRSQRWSWIVAGWSKSGVRNRVKRKVAWSRWRATTSSSRLPSPSKTAFSLCVVTRVSPHRNGTHNSARWLLLLLFRGHGRLLPPRGERYAYHTGGGGYYIFLHYFQRKVRWTLLEANKSRVLVLLLGVLCLRVTFYWGNLMPERLSKREKITRFFFR